MGLEDGLEKNEPRFTREEWKQFCGGYAKLDSEEQREWMERKGIKFDSGHIQVRIDGERVKMVTDRNDFGTIVDETREKPTE